MRQSRIHRFRTPTWPGMAMQPSRRFCRGGPRVVIEKVGDRGARVHERSEAGTVVTDAQGFPVEVVNVLGAGDAFGAGLIYGHVQGWSWTQAARLGNACGAIVVTRHGCANFMPTLQEAMDLADRHGGL